MDERRKGEIAYVLLKALVASLTEDPDYAQNAKFNPSEWVTSTKEVAKATSVPFDELVEFAAVLLADAIVVVFKQTVSEFLPKATEVPAKA